MRRDEQKGVGRIKGSYVRVGESDEPMRELTLPDKPKSVKQRYVWV